MQTKVIKIDPENIDLAKVRQAAEVIRKGGVVGFPTETVYGLAADSGNKEAVERIFALKVRPRNRPLPVQIEDIAYLERLDCEVSAFAYQLMSRFWPGPLTLVLKSENQKTVGVRVPAHRVARLLIRESRTPIVAPSANLSGEPAAKTAQELLAVFDGLIELVIDSGKAELEIASTVVDLTVFPYRILREGSISREDIQSVQN